MAIQRSNINRMLGSAGKLDLRFLTFTALEDNSTIQLNSNEEELQYLPDEVFLEYSINGGKWRNYNFVTTTNNETGKSIINGDIITLLVAGDFVQFRARTHEVNGVSVNTNGAFAKMKPNDNPQYTDPMGYYMWETSEHIECSGNIQSLLHKFAETYYVPDCAFFGMFMNSKVTTTPFLGGRELRNRCYARMFENCTYLTKFDINDNLYCHGSRTFYRMFCGCTNLNWGNQNIPTIDITRATYPYYSFNGMFKGCTSLETCLYLKLPSPCDNDAFCEMFKGCTNLITTYPLPEYLPSPQEGVYQNCSSMFEGCTKLIFPTITSIFCSNSTNANIGNRFDRMYKGCTALTCATITPRESVQLKEVFYNCSNLTSIALNANAWSYDNNGLRLDKMKPIIDWIKQNPSGRYKPNFGISENFTYGVPTEKEYELSSGSYAIRRLDFYCPDTLNVIRGLNFIPFGWDIHTYKKDNWLKLTTGEDNNTITLQIVGDFDEWKDWVNVVFLRLQYKTNTMSSWEDIDLIESNGSFSIELQNTGDYVFLRNNINTIPDIEDGLSESNNQGYFNIQATKDIHASGDIFSLICSSCIPYNAGYLMGVFRNCTKLKTPPETSNPNILSAIGRYVFYGTGITSFPKIPKIINSAICELSILCAYCPNLTEGFIPKVLGGIPKINNMFRGCTSLNRVVSYSDRASSTANTFENVAENGVFVCSPECYTSEFNLPNSWTIKTFSQDACDRFPDIANMVRNHPAIEDVINAHPFLIDVLHQYNGLVHSLVNTGLKPYMIPHGDIYETDIVLSSDASFSLSFEKQNIDDCVGVGSIGSYQWDMRWTMCFEDITDNSQSNNQTHTYYFKGHKEGQFLNNTPHYPLDEYYYSSSNIPVGKHIVEIGSFQTDYFNDCLLDGSTPTSGLVRKSNFPVNVSAIPILYINGVARQELNYSRGQTNIFAPFYQSEAKYFEIKVYKTIDGVNKLANHIVPIATGVFADIADLDNIKTYTSEFSHSYIFGSGVESRTSEFGTEAISS